MQRLLIRPFTKSRWSLGCHLNLNKPKERKINRVYYTLTAESKELREDARLVSSILKTVMPLSIMALQGMVSL